MESSFDKQRLPAHHEHQSRRPACCKQLRSWSLDAAVSAPLLSDVDATAVGRVRELQVQLFASCLGFEDVRLNNAESLVDILLAVGLLHRASRRSSHEASSLHACALVPLASAFQMLSLTCGRRWSR
ncbi:TPA: hypothetical protein N0F65_011816 [Lagenidium giganteum]|uniref:Uncharacterized protein n=1 Tax=Lagenidium giganteum TaxID=4803 RepID=A0AAV2Z3B1_9STRA|nr:TPA: hypothetical protein N0F65_011816 [Lagenidium giganteum]